MYGYMTELHTVDAERTETVNAQGFVIFYHTFPSLCLIITLLPPPDPLNFFAITQILHANTPLPNVIIQYEILFLGHDLLSLLFHFLDELLFLFCAEPFFIGKVVS